MTRSHWVAAGSGMRIAAWSRSRRLNGSPVPYFSSPTMLVALASYFSVPTPGGEAAV
ncbi:MAG: hypothetical protein ACREFT_01340 [Acetobacteraceae bacterium]